MFFEVKFSDLFMHVTSYLHNLNANYNLTLSSVSPSSSYATVSVNSASLSDTFGYTLSESTDNQRFARFMNPVFKYDFKVGNYMTDDMKKNESTSFHFYKRRNYRNS